MILQKVVNLSQYPIDTEDSAQYAKFVEETKFKYEKDGIVILKNFLTEEAVDNSVNDVLSGKDEFWMVENTHTVFLDRAKGDPAFPDSHIR